MSGAPGRSGRAEVDPARLAAAHLLARWALSAAPVGGLVAGFEAGPGASPARWPYVRRRRVRELVFGAVRLRGRYDAILQRYARRPAEIQPRVRAILWVALHELCEHDAPAYAVVDQAVACARRMGAAHAAGFVNGLLRRVASEGVHAGFPDPQADPLGHARLWLSHPAWLVERWSHVLPVSEVVALCDTNNHRAPLTLRAPHTKREQVARRLAALEWETRLLPWGPDALEVVTRVPAPLALEQAGRDAAIQDEAAQLVAPLLTAAQPHRILDLCAAPGGKCTHLAGLTADAALIVALDRSPRRLRRLVAGAARMGARSICAVAADGRQAPLHGGYDAVLVDAPCTGTGVLSRRYEARWRRTPEDLLRLPRLQLALLEAAVELTRPGGTIVYATCSLEREENDDVVDALRARRSDVEETGADGLAPSAVVDGGRLRTWPHRHGTDGSFAAVLRRRGGSP